MSLRRAVLNPMACWCPFLLCFMACAEEVPAPSGFVFSGATDDYPAIQAAVKRWVDAGYELTVRMYEPGTGPVTLASEWLIAFSTSEQYVASGYPDLKLIQLNGNVGWYNGVGFCEGVLFDLQTAVEHEIGHTLGVPHSGDRHSVMYPVLAPCERRHEVLP